jgi:hypothetical protein
LPYVHACAIAGICDQVWRNWKRDDPAFRARVDRAIARGVERRLKKIDRASNAGDWRASAWLLEHTQPQHFARNRIEITGADGQPLAGAIAVYLPQKESALTSRPALKANGDGETKLITERSGADESD